MPVIRRWLLRIIGGAPLLEACEFYAEHPSGDILRGTVGRWAPGTHPAPQPNYTYHDEPSMRDFGTIARWALDEWHGR
jgi:hypothetical protein